MTEPRTPAQAAYEAATGDRATAPWLELPHEVRQFWTNVANAVAEAGPMGAVERNLRSILSNSHWAGSTLTFDHADFIRIDHADKHALGLIFKDLLALVRRANEPAP